MSLTRVRSSVSTPPVNSQERRTKTSLGDVRLRRSVRRKPSPAVESRRVFLLGTRYLRSRADVIRAVKGRRCAQEKVPRRGAEQAEAVGQASDEERSKRNRDEHARVVGERVNPSLTQHDGDGCTTTTAAAAAAAVNKESVLRRRAAPETVPIAGDDGRARLSMRARRAAE